MMEMEERLRIIKLANIKCGLNQNEIKKVHNLSDIIRADAYDCGGIRGNKYAVRMTNQVSSSDRSLVKECMNTKAKEKNAYQSKLMDLIQIEPNNMILHFLNAILCNRLPDKSSQVIKSLSTCVYLNPNFKTAWAGLYNKYKKQGGFYTKDTFMNMYYTTRSILLLEENTEKWKEYMNELIRCINFTKDERKLNILFDILGLFVDHYDIEKQKYVCHIISYFTFEKSFVNKPYVFKAYENRLKNTKENERMGFFYVVSRTLASNDLPMDLCDFIVKMSSMNILKFKYSPLMSNLAVLLFEMCGKYSLEAIGKLMAENNGFEQDFNRHTQMSNYLNHISSYMYIKVAKYLGQQNFPYDDNKRIIYTMAVEKLNHYERMFHILTHDIYMQRKGSPVFKWYFKKFIVLLCKTNDLILQKIGISCATRFIEKYGFDAEIAYGIGLANIKVNNDCSIVYAPLYKSGCIQVVVYLKALLDPCSKYLKLIPVSLNNYILNIRTYLSTDKRAKIKRNMIMASISINYNSVPFEWLGYHYIQENYNPERAFNYFKEAVNINPYSLMSVLSLGDVICNEIGESVGKLYLNRIKNTEMASSWGIVPACYKAGFLHLYHATNHNDYFKAVENFRICCFRKSGCKNYTQMVAEACKEYGMHRSSLGFFKECVSHDGLIHMYPFAMSAIEFGQAEKYHKYIKMARLVYITDSTNIISIYTYVSAIIEKCYSLLCSNDMTYCLFLAQIGIIITCRGISLYEDCIIMWKSLGDLLYMCGTGAENMVSVYVPSWIYNKNKNMVHLNKYECIMASLRCYNTGYNYAQDVLKSEFMYSIGYVLYHVRYLIPSQKYDVLNMIRSACMKSIESKLTWENLNMYGVILYDGDLHTESLKLLQTAFKYGYKSFAKELELNLGYVYLSQGDLANSVRCFMFRRGFDTHDDDIWPVFAMLEAAGGKPSDGLNYIIYHLYNIHSVPSISEWMFYMNIINCTTPNLKNIISYRNLCLKNYENHFYNLIFQRCKIPLKTRDMKHMNYFLMGLIQSEFEDVNGLENLHYFIRSMAYDPVDHERYSYALDSACDEIRRISGQGCAREKDMVDEILKALLIRHPKKDAYVLWNKFIGSDKHFVDFMKKAHEKTAAFYKEYVVMKNTF